MSGKERESLREEDRAGKPKKGKCDNFSKKGEDFFPEGGGKRLLRGSEEGGEVPNSRPLKAGGKSIFFVEQGKGSMI